MYSLEKVLSSLSKKRDIQIANKQIFVLSNKAVNKSYDLGSKSWGKIDYLVNHCNYKFSFIDSFDGNHN